MSEIILTDTQGIEITQSDTESRKRIPDAARTEIITIFNELNAAVVELNNKRQAFIEFVAVTRLHLGIPSNEVWDIDHDVNAFFRVEGATVRDEPITPPDPFAVDGGTVGDIITLAKGE